MVDDNKIVTIAAVIIMIFIYPIYSHNWRNIIYIYMGVWGSVVVKAQRY